MDPRARRETVGFTSTDGKTPIHGEIWWPEQEPVATVQLVHGMAEHIMRYEPFAEYLCAHGFAVCGHDHLGHGNSVLGRDRLGHLPAKAGRDILVGDVGRMREVMARRAGDDVPSFLFGHSMGSFVIRAYVAGCGQGLRGAIVCGTGHVPPALSTAGNSLARAIGRIRGEGHVSKLLGDLSIGSYAKAIAHPRTPLDWLSYNQDNVDAYIADDLCGFPFSAGGNATLTALTREVCSRRCFESTPHDLPLLFVAGDGDPVGDMGKGVQVVARMAREAGIKDVTCTIYPHMRHEILNEDGRADVMADIRAWMEERI